MATAKTAKTNGQPTAIETPPSLDISLESGEVMLLGQMLQQVNFPDPETKTLAASLQMKLGRAVQAAQDA